jgi:putative membrane protein
MKKLAILMVATATLAACATPMEDDMTAGTQSAAAVPAPADPNSPLAHPMYMQMAASSDQFEIQSSQMALQMSQNPAVQSFARLMIAHHQAMTQNLMTAAQSAGLTPPPPALLPMHQQMLQQLQASSGNFDEAYKQAQVMSHQQSLELHQNYANGGDVPALRQVASSAVPIVQQHLEQAQRLQTMPMQPMMQQPATGGESTTGGTSRAGERG